MIELNSKHSQFNICDRSFDFSLQIIQLSSILLINPITLIICKQVLRSGTSIGANIVEAQNASSKKEFIYSLTISLKEARETKYWLLLLLKSKLITELKLKDILGENEELIKILVSIIKNSKQKQ